MVSPGDDTVALFGNKIDGCFDPATDRPWLAIRNPPVAALGVAAFAVEIQGAAKDSANPTGRLRIESTK